MSQTLSTVRVIVADDSDIATTYIERLIEADPAIRVVARARNGAELLAHPQHRIAHVILVDLLMPELGGLSVIRRLSEHCAVIVVSSVDKDSAIAEEALALGAKAFFFKPGLSNPTEAQRLRDVVKAVGRTPLARSARPIVFIVGSTGAVVPLERLSQELGPLQVPLLVVQHLPEGKAEGLAQLLRTRGARAVVARHGDGLEPKLFVAPSGRHMQLDPSDRIRIVDGAAVNQHCPSGDVLFESAVRLGSRAIAVILSGLGKDGARGIKALCESGATCLAQRPEECAAAYMPRAALAASPHVRAIPTGLLGHTIRKAVESAC
jgi:two-component system, chemotaxis family, protein-glutamate methylesterase/glutaminase